MTQTENSHVSFVLANQLLLSDHGAVRQESNFFYLTGCDVANSSYVLFIPASSSSASGISIQTALLIPKEDPLETMWSPPPPTLDAARVSHPTIDTLGYTSTVVDVLSGLLKSNPDAILHTLPDGPTSPFPRLHPFFSEPSANYTAKYLLPGIHKARLIKTPFEIELIRKANAISSRAHEMIMRLLGKYAKEDILGGADEGKLVLPGEWRIEREAEGEAAFVASCRREG